MLSFSYRFFVLFIEQFFDHICLLTRSYECSMLTSLFAVLWYFLRSFVHISILRHFDPKLMFIQILRMLHVDRQGGTWRLLGSVVFIHRQVFFFQYINLYYALSNVFIRRQVFFYKFYNLLFWGDVFICRQVFLIHLSVGLVWDQV